MERYWLSHEQSKTKKSDLLAPNANDSFWHFHQPEI